MVAFSDSSDRICETGMSKSSPGKKIMPLSGSVDGQMEGTQFSEFGVMQRVNCPYGTRGKGFEFGPIDGNDNPEIVASYTAILEL